VFGWYSWCLGRRRRRGGDLEGVRVLVPRFIGGRRLAGVSDLEEVSLYYLLYASGRGSK
jgi:hypothetical protein